MSFNWIHLIENKSKEFRKNVCSILSFQIKMVELQSHFANLVKQFFTNLNFS